MSKNILESTLGKGATERLQHLVRQLQGDNARRNQRELETSDRLEALEADIGFLALLQVATLRLLESKGILGPGELTPALGFVDLMDGVVDGSLNLDTIRASLGMPRPPRLSDELQIPATTARTGVRGATVSPRTQAKRLIRSAIAKTRGNGAARRAAAARPKAAKKIKPTTKAKSKAKRR
jgi:hypothetical protein